MQQLVDSGVSLHKCIAMGMAEGQTGPGYENMPAAPMVKEDMGRPERKPGMAMRSDKY